MHRRAAACLTGAWNHWGTVLTVIILAAYIIYYACIWLFRRRPFEHNVVLGTLSNRLYLRYGRRWLVGAMAAYAVGYPALIALIEVVDHGFMGFTVDPDDVCVRHSDDVHQPARLLQLAGRHAEVY